MIQNLEEKIITYIKSKKPNGISIKNIRKNFKLKKKTSKLIFNILNNNKNFLKKNLSYCGTYKNNRFVWIYDSSKNETVTEKKIQIIKDEESDSENQIELLFDEIESLYSVSSNNSLSDIENLNELTKNKLEEIII